MTRHGMLWLFAIICIFLFAPLGVTEYKYERCLYNELSTAEKWYGDDATLGLLARAKSVYEVLMIDTGIDPMIQQRFVKPAASPDIAPDKPMPPSWQANGAKVDGYWARLLLHVWIFCIRLAHAGLWLFYLTPFLLATLFDGVMTRKAKLVSFKYTSPTIYNLSWHLIIAMVSGMLVVCAISMPVPAVIYPAALTTIALLARLVIANIQHSA